MYIYIYINYHIQVTSFRAPIFWRPKMEIPGIRNGRWGAIGQDPGEASIAYGLWQFKSL